MNIAEFAPAPPRDYRLPQLPGEPTENPALRLCPIVDLIRDRTGQRTHCLHYTGDWALIHVPTGHAVEAVDLVGALLPLVWLRRFAQLLAESDIPWHEVDGDTRLVTHPLHEQVREIGRKVLDCWRRGVPIAPVHDSLRTDGECYQLVCANLACESEFSGCDEPEVLTGAGDDGQDEVLVDPHDVDALFEIARLVGWRRLPEHQSHRWLCEDCAATHTPAPDHLARRFPRPATAVVP